MFTRKTTLFFTVLVAIALLAVGMVIASRLDFSPASSAQSRPSSVPVANSAPLDGPIDALTFRRIAEEEISAVVSIRTESAPSRRQLSEIPDDLLRRFFGPGVQPPQQDPDAPPQQGGGTGFVIDDDGHILTNNHVVDGADRIFVSQFGAGRTEEYEAVLVGHDSLTDSALIRLKDRRPAGLGLIRFGDSDQMQPGDWVMAIGNPFGLGHTVTVGVISARGRPLGGVQGRPQNMLQTDAAINPGNSGGPLLNIRGEVVGINTSIITDQRQANLGIGFAMPINVIRDILPQLKSGKVTRGVIGVQVATDPITTRMAQAFGLPNTNGAVVSTVTEDGPAEKGGIQPGDVVVEFAGQPIADSGALVDLVVHTTPGTTVPVVVVRNRGARRRPARMAGWDLGPGRAARRGGGGAGGGGADGHGSRDGAAGAHAGRGAPARGARRPRRRRRQLRRAAQPGVQRGPDARRRHPQGQHRHGDEPVAGDPRAAARAVGRRGVPARLARRAGSVRDGQQALTGSQVHGFTGSRVHRFSGREPEPVNL